MRSNSRTSLCEYRGYERLFASVEHAYAGDRARLLRTGGERPRCRAAEQRDELAPFYLIELHSVPVSQGRIVGYRIGEEESGGNGAILQPVSSWRGRPLSEVGQTR